jgi:hypothetical protein
LTNEYPIDSEFWKWWNTYWAKNSTNEKIDISLDFCYNNYIKERKKENPKNGTVEFHECPPRLEDSARG